VRQMSRNNPKAVAHDLSSIAHRATEDRRSQPRLPSRWVGGAGRHGWDWEPWLETPRLDLHGSSGDATGIVSRTWSSNNLSCSWGLLPKPFSCQR
jgi:hypothetical protein